jgi:cellulose synthase/poly-beta-1,6-N-acetylglucosamine synthase-like glycosyltransferase
LKKNKYQIDLLIPAYNAEATLEECLDSVFSLKLNEHQLNVYVIDNASTDKTSLIAKKFNLNLLHCPKRGRSVARNYGLHASNSELVAFVDSDVVLDNNWLLNLIELFSHESIGGVQGQVIPKRSTFVDNYIYHYKEVTTNSLFIEMESREGNYPLIDTAACIYRRKTLLSVKGFDESLPFHEDKDLSLRLVAKGFSIRSALSAHAFKAANRTPLAYLTRTIESSKTLAQYSVTHFHYKYFTHLKSFNHLNSLKGFKKLNWKIRTFARLVSLLDQLTYFFSFSYFYFTNRSKHSWSYSLSKTNLLLPLAIKDGIPYAFSPSTSFYLSHATLILYQRGKIPKLINDIKLIKWFEAYLNGEAKTMCEEFDYFYENEAFVPQTSLTMQKH